MIQSFIHRFIYSLGQFMSAKYNKKNMTSIAACLNHPLTVVLKIHYILF